MFLPYKKATLLITSGPSHDPERKHLFVIITDPVKYLSNKQVVLLCPICTIKPNQFYDPACIIQPDKHSFIIKQSYVAYKYSRIESANKLTRGVALNIFQPKEPVSDALYKRICRGLETSRFTTTEILNFYYYYLNLPCSTTP